MTRSRVFIPPLYPIIDSSLTPSADTEKTATNIINGGARIIQLRTKGLSSREFLKSAFIVRKITKDRDVIFIVNDRVDIALIVDADGIHLGQDDLPANEARRLLGNDRIIGYSTHNLREALEAVRLPIDYISFGPIFPTQTKEDAQTPKGLKGLAEVKNAVKIPIVAIGGITETNMIRVLKQGANSVAMISEILTAPDISKKLNRLNIIAKDGLKADGWRG